MTETIEIAKHRYNPRFGGIKSDLEFVSDQTIQF